MQVFVSICLTAHPGMPHKTKFLSSLGFDQTQAKLLMQQWMGLGDQLTT